MVVELWGLARCKVDGFVLRGAGRGNWRLLRIEDANSMKKIKSGWQLWCKLAMAATRCSGRLVRLAGC
ncbi:hypothetical protein V6N13_105210 [Hibiscus sabdariffa]